MRKENWLRVLQVRVARECGVLLAFGQIDQCSDDSLDLGLAQLELPRSPQAQISGHLIVTTPSGVQLLAKITNAHDQLSLHPRMNVLILGLGQDGGILMPCDQNFAERLLDGPLLGNREHAGANERLAPRDASLDVLTNEQLIEGKAVVELAEQGVRLAFKASCPDGGGHEQFPFPPQQPPLAAGAVDVAVAVPDAVVAAAPAAAPVDLQHEVAAPPSPCAVANCAASTFAALASALKPKRARIRMGRLNRRMKPSLCLWS